MSSCESWEDSIEAANEQPEQECGGVEPCPHEEDTVPLVEIFPRSKAKLFIQGSTTDYQELLTGYLKGGPHGDPWAAIEHRFYVDIATDVDGTFKGHRKLTAVVREPDGTPAANRPTSWTRVSGSGELRFLDAAGGEKTSLEGSDVVNTDSDGLAEVVVTHPARSVAAGDATLRIQVEAEEETATCDLAITRNDAVTAIDDITRRNAANADPIWSYQPSAAQRTDRNAGLEALAEATNEVVARHRSIANYTFTPLNGVYGDEQRQALGQYLSTFTGVTAGNNYPYDLADVNVAEELRDYVETEYVPFDPNDAATRGWIVDRRLLIGDSWSLQADQIDGLLELKEGIVDRLREQMVELADQYIDRDTFWLHNPVHRPHPNAAARVFRVTQNNTSVRAAANNTANVIYTASDGDLFPSPGVQGAYTRVTVGNDQGFISSNRGRRIRDNQSIDSNSGNHGNGAWADGVAYSYGCKDLPDAYTAQLESNPSAPPNDGDGHQLRIAHWDEYQNHHKVGRRASDDGWQGDMQIPNHTGCDCSGLCQNCITQATLPAPHQNVRVVPNAVTQEVVVNQNRVPLHAIGTGTFVSLNHARRAARRMPAPDNDAYHQWIRQGDVIRIGGHIVFVAEDRPNVRNNNNTFEVYNEYGGDRYRLANGAWAPVDNTRFLRKAIRMPFHYWRRTLAGAQIGKVFIWA